MIGDWNGRTLWRAREDVFVSGNMSIEDKKEVRTAVQRNQERRVLVI